MKKISPERKATYYVGLGMTGLGFLLFISTFFTFASDFGNFNNFEQNAQRDFSRAVLGMVLMIGGGVVASIGARGVAGSGLKLDPEQAREDLQPWTKMAGGMVSDALEEVQLPSNKSETIKVRCQSCKTLNDEDASYCKSCGGSL